MVALTYGVARAAARKMRETPAIRGKSETPGFFSRLYQGMMDARLRQAARELELHRHLWDRTSR